MQLLIRFAVADENIIVKDPEVHADALKTITKALNIFAEYLFGKRLSRNISLLVKFELLNCNGMVSWVDNNYKPRDFEMLLDPENIGSWENLILTLAHEMIHIKQYVRDELFQSLKTPSNVIFWCKKEIAFTALDEFERPWEKEAYNREYEVAQEYWKTLNVNP